MSSGDSATTGPGRTGGLEINDAAARIDAISQDYARRIGFERDGDWIALKLTEEVGELMQIWLARTGRQRDRGLDAEEIESRFRRELADVLGMVAVLGHSEGVDLEAAIAEKWLVWEGVDDDQDPIGTPIT